jgi:hypothetical protein
MNNKTELQILAFYLPQFHPIPENDEWWGKGFTEWTNVGKARPLFRSHEQPKVPADLGYYDLRLEETRIAQAEMAKEYGINGFNYWHYWFGNGKRLLEMPFEQILSTGKPDFPFCLTWANHSWKAKTWHHDYPDKLLIEQSYLGEEDYTYHFNSLLPAFKDKRYIRVDGKPLFGIYAPNDFPDYKRFIELWNELAIQNDLKGIYFCAYITIPTDKSKFLDNGFDAVTIDYLHDFFHSRSYYRKVLQNISMKLKLQPKVLPYKKYVAHIKKHLQLDNNIFPCLLPNYDHTPRSGYRGLVLKNSYPEYWSDLLNFVLNKMKKNNNSIELIFIKSWNEWAEGNYLEPDLKYKRKYLEVIKEALTSYE